MREITKEEKSAAVDVYITIAQLIRELGEVPSGHLYAKLMDKLDFDAYMTLIASLKRTGLVVEKNHLLIWKGK